MFKDALGMVSIFGFIAISVLCLMAAKFGGTWAEKMMDTILPQVIQCWIINVTVLLQYHYGTSASSQRKSETISKLASKKQENIVELEDEIKP